MAPPPLYIAFLWHMHQPYYKDLISGRYSMPWVRLHAIKAYRDMPLLLSKYPRVSQNFNLVPSLLLQVQEYASGQAKDDFLDISFKHADDLNIEDKEFILANFFNCNWENMIKPYPRYWNLLLKRGMSLNAVQLRDILPRFSTQDFLDLQTWFNLTWFGYTSQDIPAIRELRQKGRFFSQEDKIQVLNTQKEIVEGVIPIYKDLVTRKQIEVSTSPFYHPILPLLVDSDSAKRPNPQVKLPKRFHYPEDAGWQVEEALSFHEKVIGTRPRGIWPSEGSVSPELIPVLSKLGVKWAATDEGILFNSPDAYHGKNALYYPYVVEHGGARVNMLFRDHTISDLFGFVYYRNETHDAVADFFHRLYNIRNGWGSGRSPLLLSIILDGENAWEYYSDGGKSFLSQIYEQLSHNPDFKTTTISNYLDDFPPERSFSNLYTGSWINHNFDIWIGGFEENAAWKLLGQTRSFLAERLSQKTDWPEQKVSRAWEALHAAEGSDWFWWYGDQFASAYSYEFDRLFRQHLIQVYKALDAEVPGVLSVPLKQIRKIVPLREPAGFIHPVLDGRETQFFEWSGAGYYEVKTVGGAMYQGAGKISALWYGFDVDNFYFRLDSAEKVFSMWPAEKEIYIHFLNNRPAFLKFAPCFQGERLFYRLYNGKPEQNEFIGDFHSIGLGKFVELSVPFKSLNFRIGEEIRFFLEVREKGLVEERCPSAGYLSLIVPDENFEKVHWQI